MSAHWLRDTTGQQTRYTVAAQCIWQERMGLGLDFVGGDQWDWRGVEMTKRTDRGIGWSHMGVCKQSKLSVLL